MKIFRMGRGEGKTSKLIAESTNSGVPILLSTKENATI